MKVLSATQMREADRLTTERYGIPGIELMENAGNAIAEFLLERFPELHRRKILVLCGKGNNGGDGIGGRQELEKILAPRRSYFFSRIRARLSGDAAANLKRWQQGLGELYVVTSESGIMAIRARVALAEARI